MSEPNLDLERLPRHVGLILDGNGRWAERRGLHRTAGHIAGEETLFQVVDTAIDIGLEWMTAYTFSTENWSRSPEEVAFLMSFHTEIMGRRRAELHERGVRMLFAGDLEDARIPQANLAEMEESVATTANNTGLNMVFAFNYGGRTEIARAAKALATEAVSGDIDPDNIDEDALAARLSIPEMPDCDLVIRTSGELRLSNFLLWQAAYAELLFVETLWPDFGRAELVAALAEYQRRTRRFGTA